MTNVNPLFRFPHVVIYRALVSKTTIECEDGPRTVESDPPQPTYFVDFIDEDGGRCGDWRGPLHSMALEAAAAWGVRVVDQTDGRRQS